MTCFHAHAVAAYHQQLTIARVLDDAFSAACGGLNRFDDAHRLSPKAKAAGDAYAAHSDTRHAAYDNMRAALDDTFGTG